MNKIYNLTNDHLYKLIFKEEKYLKYLLNTFFDIDVANKKIKYLNPELLSDNKFSKVGIVDLLITIENNVSCEYILLELQNINRYNFVQRLDFYVSAIKTNHCLDKVECFTKIKPLKALAIINYDLCYNNIKNSVKLITKDKVNKNYTYKVFNNNFSYEIFNLSKIQNNDLNKWQELVMLFKETNLSILEENIKSSIGKQILKQIKMFNLDKKGLKKMDDIVEMMMNEKEDYNAARLYGKNEGINIGISQGITKRNKEIAREMKKENMDYKLISKLTELSIEQIESLH